MTDCWDCYIQLLMTGYPCARHCSDEQRVARNQHYNDQLKRLSSSNPLFKVSRRDDHT